MSKSKKSSNNGIKSKALTRKKSKRASDEHLSDPSWVNKTVGKALDASVGDPSPFTFIITIAVNSTITIKSINLDGVIATEEDFKINDANIICVIEASVSIFTFLLMIDAEGDPDTMTTFNMTCDGKKVFDQDQEITITSTGRGGYVNKKVPLP